MIEESIEQDKISVYLILMRNSQSFGAVLFILTLDGKSCPSDNPRDFNMYFTTFSIASISLEINEKISQGRNK